MSTAPKPHNEPIPAPIHHQEIPAAMLPDFIMEEEFEGFDIPWLGPTEIVANVVDVPHPRLPDFIIDE